MEKLKINLHLFDGAAGDGGAGVGATAGEQGETEAESAATRQTEETGEKEIRYGVQEDAGDEGRAADGDGSKSDSGNSEEDDAQNREKEFKSLIRGKFKDLYDGEVQKIINSRFKANKQNEERLASVQGLVDILGERYKDAGGDIGKLTEAIANDSSLWAEEAAKADMSDEQYRAFKNIERENAKLKAAEKARQEDEYARSQADKWNADAESLKAEYKDFDLGKELQNSEFVSALRSGMSMKKAYQSAHFDDLMKSAVESARTDTQKKTVQNIQARGMRPSENSGAAHSAFTIKSDVNALTDEDIDEIARRVARGEKISFG